MTAGVVRRHGRKVGCDQVGGVVMRVSGVLASLVLATSLASFAALPARAVSISIAPVPLPAGGLLLLAALGGVALIRRRRKG